MAKLNVGFIGCGGIARAHFGPVSKLPNAKMIGFCDVDLDRAQKAADEFSGKAFQTPAEMLDSIKLDAVWVCLPPFAHGAAELACVEHGVPFMVEKPINRSLQQARRIADAVAEKGLLTAVAYMNRYRKGVQLAKAMFDEDPPVLAMGGWIGGPPRPDPNVSISMWWIQKDKSGGQFIEQVTHTADLLRYLCGEPMQVSAFAAQGFNRDIPGYTIEDAIVVSIKMANGGVAQLQSCCASGAHGGVDLRVFAPKHAADFVGWGHDATLYTAGSKTGPKKVEGEGDIFDIEDKAFLKAVEKQDQSLVKSDYFDGLKTLQLTLAVDRAISTARIVKIGI